MLNLNTLYNHAIDTVLWPIFKELGYKKTGNNFRYYSSEDWGKIVQFQKSQWNSANEQSFTVNIGLYLPEYEFYHCNDFSKSRFQESICAVRKRIGYLTEAQRDEWYSFTNENDVNNIFNKLSTKINQYITPYLAKVNNREDIYQILANGHRSDFPIAQIEAMYQAGYHAAAIRLLTQEIERSRANHYYQAALRPLAQKLNLPATLWQGKP